MKCITCKQEKELLEFPKLHRYEYNCRECISVYMKRYQEKNKNNYKRNNLKKTLSNQDFLDGYKKAPCMDCGDVFPPVCMDFDHRNPKEKLADVGSLKNRRRELLIAEIEKCDLVCSNCHRVRTAKQQRAHRTTN